MGYYISKKYNIPHVWHVREYGKSESYSFLPYSRRYYDELASASRLIYISRYVEDNWKYYIPNRMDFINIFGFDQLPEMVYCDFKLFSCLFRFVRIE